MDMLSASSVHFFVHDALDSLTNPKTHRQPSEHTRCLATNIASTVQPFMAGNIRIGGVFAQRSHEEVGEAFRHALRLPAF
jgi:hypothetical protein